jgi:SAM-dependent methyltransferase
VLDVADYDNGFVQSVKGQYHRKQWEISMALATLRDHASLDADSTKVLGAGAGHEATIYHLSNDVHQVYATDLYKGAGMWTREAPDDMLTDPGKFAPDDVPYDLDRIFVEHQDMRNLLFPDGMFDAVFSSGSIEHVGTFQDVAKAASELGRVLKPGGVMSLSTEWKISGEGSGWPGVLLFTEPELYQYIIEPSGCELIDEPILQVDPQTLEHRWSLNRIVYHGQRPLVEAVITAHGYWFTSVHLGLRKPKLKRKKTIDAEDTGNTETTVLQSS